MTSDAAGVLTLVWDNTYSLITSREVVLRVAVKRWCVCECSWLDPKAVEEAVEVEVPAQVEAPEEVAKVDAPVDVPAETTPAELTTTPETTEQPPATEPETAPENTQTEEPATNDQPVIEATVEETAESAPVAPVHKKED